MERIFNPCDSLKTQGLHQSHSRVCTPVYPTHEDLALHLSFLDRPKSLQTLPALQCFFFFSLGQTNLTISQPSICFGIMILSVLLQADQ